MKKIIVATRNKGKISEFKSLMQGMDIEFLSLESFPEMPEIVENGNTFLENALRKASGTTEFTGIPSLSDDSGLVVDALGGLPGVMSARFAPTNDERIDKLLKLMENVPDNIRTARFICALAFVKPDGFIWTTECSCEGIITQKPSGNGGFGYDPVFLFEPLGQTFAEIAAEIKNGISHRGKALVSFKKAIQKCEIYI